MLFNQQRAEHILARDGIDVIVATSPDNVMYATDYECITHWGNKGFQVYSLFAPADTPQASLIAPSLELDSVGLAQSQAALLDAQCLVCIPVGVIVEKS